MRRLLRRPKAAREAAGLSHADIARRCRIAPAMLSRLERGLFKAPAAVTLFRYAALGRD